MKKILLFATIIISSISCFAQLPSWLPANGLVAWYPFSGNTIDSSGHGNDAINVGATFTTDRFGQVNKACWVDTAGGMFHYLYGSCDSFPTNARSVSVWVKPLTLYATNGTGIFGYGGLSCGQSFFLDIAFDSTYVVSGHCGNHTMIDTNETWTITNTWRHWVVTNDSASGTTFYMDGIMVHHDSSIYSNDTYVQGRNFIVGGVPNTDGMGLDSTDGNVWPMRGAIDDIAIYNRALTAAEVAQMDGITESPTVKSDICMRVFPNPSTGNFTVEVPSVSGNLWITDALGRLCYTVVVNGQKQNIHLTQTGFYVVHFSSGAFNLIQKLWLIQ